MNVNWRKEWQSLYLILDCYLNENNDEAIKTGAFPMGCSVLLYMWMVAENLEKDSRYDNFTRY